MTVGTRLAHMRSTGCLLGVAIGDALGAPVEFTGRGEIVEAHGPHGVETFLPWTNDAGIALPAGSTTDDTQMTVATARGLLDALTQWRASGIDDLSGSVWVRYLEWLESQRDPFTRRFPGSTCLSALMAELPGTVDDPVNDSKGSGGVMRVAPVGIAYLPDRAFEYGVEAAALTHGHPSGYLAAGFLSDVVSRLVRGAGRDSVVRGQGAVAAAVAASREVLLGWDDHDEVLEKVDMAIELYVADAPVDQGVEMLGEGWIAEEALGIALFCALSYPADFEEGVLASVNITGDSDTTGSMTGALLGAVLGVHAIRSDWIERVEGSALLRCLADELVAGYQLDTAVDPDRCV